jgi:CHAT domain-containing protein/Tfp pilus assembly protein PilF
VNLGRELVSLLRLRGSKDVNLKLIIFLIFLTLKAFSDTNYEQLCDDLVKKENNLSLIKDYCLKTAQQYEKKGDIDNASGYYLLADKYPLIINKFTKQIPKNSSAIYSNIGHSYIFFNNFKEGEKYYKKFLISYHNPNQAMQNDFEALSKIYPKYKFQLIKAKEIWDKIYKPLIELDELYLKLDNLKKGQESIKLLEKIIFIKEKYLNHTLSIAYDYQNLATIFEEQFSEYDKALTFYKKMLIIYLDLLGEEFTETSTAYYNIANIANLKGEYANSLTFYKKVLKIDLKLFGEKSLEITSTYHNMANVYTNLNQFEKALEYYKKSLEIDLDILDNQHENITSTYHQIANIFTFQGKYDEALELYIEVLDRDLEKFGENNVYISGLYHNIGNVLQHKGEYSESLKFYKNALKIDLNLFGEHHANTVTTLEGMGYLYHKIGNHDKALKIYLKALEINLDLFGLSHPNTATTYHHIAYIYQDKTMYNEALEVYNMALDIRVQVLGKNNIGTASTYHNIGNILEDLGAYKEALMEYERAISIEIYRLGENNPIVANSYNNIGNVKKETQKYDEALINYQKALAINLKMLRKNHPTLAINYHNIGATYFHKKEYKNAYINSKKSFDIFTKNKKININALDKREKKKYLSYNQNTNRLSNLFRTIWFYLKETSFENKLSREAFEYWLQYKGILFEYQNLLSMIEKNPKTNTKTKQNIKELKKLTIQLDNLDNSDIKPKNYKEQKSKIEEQIHDIEVNLSQQNQKFQEQLDLQKISYQDISTQLKSNQLYIDFARGVDNYYIFTLDSQNNITFKQIDKNRSQDIDSNITIFLDINKKIAKDVTNKKLIESLKPQTETLLSNLYGLLITKNIKQNKLIISPDGLLNFLPFEALFDGNKYLVENYTVSYISSGREFMRQIKREKQAKLSRVIIFANPDFQLELTEDFSRGTKIAETLFDIDPLVKLDAKEEIEVIKSHYKEVIVYQEENATVNNLFKINPPKILHISTHGILLNNKNILNPMKRSVLAFSGADNAKYQGDARGFATALKLSSLNLEGTELVVLSACDTGLGEIHQAEGVIGLPKAFIQAGAKKVIMSLWSVSDNQTALLMRYFYDSISSEKDYSMAFREAKLKMITMHPYFWSAFIINGI